MVFVLSVMTRSVYDAPKHHFHKVGSTGASCVECHMPESIYMSIDRRRDHSIRVPRPDLSQKFGSPNACTGCHLDEEKKHQSEHYQSWLAQSKDGNSTLKKRLSDMDASMTESFLKWYGDKDHPGSLWRGFSRSAFPSDQTPSPLLSIAGNAMGYGPVVRATAIDLMRNFPLWQDKNILLKWAKDDSSFGASSSCFECTP